MKNLMIILILSINSLAFAQEDSKYCNGQVIKDGFGSYYPNGQVTEDHFGSYYPNGTTLKDQRSVYYPNGQAIEDSWGAYYPTKQKIKDNWGTYYHNGQIVKNSFGECFFSNGQKMYPCQDIVDARMFISQGLIMNYRLETKNGKISNLRFEESVSGTRTLYEVSLTGKISNINVYCDQAFPKY